jgi:hypothetical protein
MPFHRLNKDMFSTDQNNGEKILNLLLYYVGLCKSLHSRVFLIIFNGSIYHRAEHFPFHQSNKDVLSTDQSNGEKILNLLLYYVGLCKSLKHSRVFLTYSTVVFIEGRNIGLFISQTRIGFPLIKIKGNFFLLLFYTSLCKSL